MDPAMPLTVNRNRVSDPAAFEVKKTIRLLLSAVTLLGFAAADAYSQEALKMSLAGADASDARRKAASTVGYYNLQLGQTYWRFAGGLGAEYNSNVNLNQDGAEDDYILRPEIDVKLLVPVSDKNSLNVSVGAGYSAYIMHSELRRYYVTPDTAVSFDVYAGDFWINVHDRVSVSENSYEDPTVSGNGNYSQLQNAIGIGAVWDLNKLVARFGYDHANYLTLSGGGSGRPDGEAELFSAAAGCRVGAGLELGVELGGGFLTYGTSGTNAFFSNATEWNAGTYCEATITEYTHLRINAGYTQYLPELKTAGSAPTFSGVYAELDLTHRLNQYVTYTLSAGRTINFAFSGGTVDLYFAKWNANWKIFEKTSVNTSFNFEHGSQLGSGAETFDRYGPELSLGRTLTEKMSGSIGCQFFWRASDTAGRDYVTLIVSSSLRYQF